MLRPERMSRVSVTGSKRVMGDVIDTVHGLRLFDVTDYDGAWEGFEPGSPSEGADRASEKLVVVRSLEAILDIDSDEEDTSRSRVLTDDALDEELEEVRSRVNELDDRRDDLDAELRQVEERLGAVQPFVDLGIDLDLLQGYDNLNVIVGQGDREAVRGALADAKGVDNYEIFGEEESLAVFVYPETAAVEDALVGANFTRLEIPEATSDPESYVSDLSQRRQELQSELDTVEGKLDDLGDEVGGFLLAAEEKLSIEVQKREAPLSFATTKSAFVGEGWLPTENFVDLAEALHDEVGEHVEVEELERADYDEHGFATATETTDSGDTAASGAAVTDGGHATGDVVMSGGEPPVVQDNPDAVKPFEALVEVINRPKYWELDPTVILFLTFPLFFGFMIGDLGYGLLYMGIGYLLMSRFDSDIIRSLGGVGLLAGVATAIFGILYGEIFGLHQLGEIVWGGNPPIHKGLTPAHADYALGWLVLSLLAGIAHLTIGWIFDFYENLSHGFGDAMLESGSWLMMMFGLWTWIFAGAAGKAPEILVGSESVFNGHPFPLGFTGFSPTVGLVGLAVFAVGLALLVYGEPIEGVEFLNVLVNVLSYTRLAAVLLAKAGMAFVVNLLFFGVYVTHGEHGNAWHFGINGMPQETGVMYHGHEVSEIMFGGLVHGGVAAALVGVLILVIGHLLVLALGVTSAGLQAVRLEYVEFFGKFYEGGGRDYEPFGLERRFTTED